VVLVSVAAVFVGVDGQQVAGAQIVATSLLNDTLSLVLDSLVARAIATSPAIRAASMRVDAAGARIGPATARPDPMFIAGIQNLPISRPGFSSDEMTMKVIGASQTIPYPGKLALRRAVAEREADASRVAVEVARRRVVREVRDAYYELAFLDQALEITQKNEDVLGTFVRTAEARYGTGVAGQQDVLKARVEASRLAETASDLTEQRRAALARLNAQLTRASDAPIAQAQIPATLIRAAAGDSTQEPMFTSAALGARAAGSPFQLLADLQQLAIDQSPELREHEAMIAAQAARIEVARKDYLPDFDVSVQYGQRNKLPDMVSVGVSVALPVQRKQKQDQVVVEASATLAALHEEHQAKVNEIRAEVAQLVSALERSRAQLALMRRAILPQASASLASALASYQVGKVEFLTVLDNQSTVFMYETEYYRAIADFARNVAELERIVGAEVLR
jgi:cobalt-zinc-cadmium efflux system outer membrane protein